MSKSVILAGEGDRYQKVLSIPLGENRGLSEHPGFEQAMGSIPLLLTEREVHTETNQQGQSASSTAIPGNVQPTSPQSRDVRILQEIDVILKALSENDPNQVEVLGSSPDTQKTPVKVSIRNAISGQPIMDMRMDRTDSIQDVLQALHKDNSHLTMRVMHNNNLLHNRGVIGDLLLPDAMDLNLTVIIEKNLFNDLKILSSRIETYYSSDQYIEQTQDSDNEDPDHWVYSYRNIYKGQTEARAKVLSKNREAGLQLTKLMKEAKYSKIIDTAGTSYMDTKMILLEEPTLQIYIEKHNYATRGSRKLSSQTPRRIIP